MGILANTASKTHSSSSSDDVSSGYASRERVTLSTNPTAASYSWGLSAPVSSGMDSTALSSTTAASPTFTPDVAGTYVVTCIAASTTYVLRMTVHSVGISHLTEVIRLSPVADSAVPAPANGRSLYYSSTQNALCVKDPADDVFTVDVTAVP